MARRLYDTNDLSGALEHLERWTAVLIGTRHAAFGIRLVMHVVSAALHALQSMAASMLLGPYRDLDMRITALEERLKERTDDT